LVGDRAQARTMDREWCKAIFARVDGRPHQAQRLGNAVHWTAADRLVTVERERAALLRGQPAWQQTYERTGVADIDRPVGHPCLAQARAAYRDDGSRARRWGIALVHERAQRPDRRERRFGVGRMQIILDAGRL